ncbi:MAG: DUF1134 domain-containing protein [Burkholderiaceae bacterium]|nr:DUF1134 domain-containing protein [Burkholderiaceae bacterium]
MNPSISTRRETLVQLIAGGAALALPAWAIAAESEANTYDKDTISHDVTEFFGSTTEGLAKVIEKAFAEHGRPNGYIKGEEGSAAVTIGVRYGNGTLTLKSGGSKKVYWSGPSIGFDLGANASKVFILVYRLNKADDIFKRYAGVDGSLYYVGGAGINYQRRGSVVLAPIRLGVGLRAGASVGYMHYRREKSWLPL